MAQESKSRKTVNSVDVKPYKLSELASLFSIHRDTMRTWIKVLEPKIGTRKGHYYTTVQVDIIFDHHPPPRKVEIDNPVLWE